MGTGLLPPDAIDRFVTSCQESVGHALRSVIYFTLDEFENLATALGNALAKRT